MQLIDLNESLPKNTKIFRYIDLPEFLDIVVNQHIFFLKVTSLTDKYEHESVFEKILEDLISTEYNFYNITKQEQNEFKQNMIEMRNKSFISSWTFEEDNYALWKIYTNNSPYGICIETTIEKFLNNIHLIDKMKMFHGEVSYEISYKGIEEIALNMKHNSNSKIKHSNKTVQLLFFNKIESYRYENEYRFAVVNYDSKSNNGIKIKCDIDNIIDKVHLSPFMPSWFEQNFFTIQSCLLQNSGFNQFVKSIRPIFRANKISKINE